MNDFLRFAKIYARYIKKFRLQNQKSRFSCVFAAFCLFFCVFTLFKQFFLCLSCFRGFFRCFPVFKLFCRVLPVFPLFRLFTGFSQGYTRFLRDFERFFSFYQVLCRFHGILNCFSFLCSFTAFASIFGIKPRLSAFHLYFRLIYCRHACFQLFRNIFLS